MRKEKTIQVLLIEDDPEDTFLFTELIAQTSWPSLNFVMVCAPNLETGLKHLEKGGIDLVLLDLMLPDSQGLETFRRLRARFPRAPVAVLTGMSDESLGLEAVSLGAQDYLLKGAIDGLTLKRAVSFAVERSRLTAQMEGIIENAADGMAVVDTEGRVLYLNPAAEALLGKPVAEALGKPIGFPLAANTTTEMKLPGEEGEKDVEMRVTELEWRDGPARLASLRDVSELKRVEQLKAEVRERQRMDKLKDELMSTVSHEMRTPLAVGKGAVDTLWEGLAGTLSQAQKNLVDLAHRNLDRVARAVEGILNLSRLESGRAEVCRQRTSLAPLIEDAVQGFQLLQRDKPLSIETDLAPDLPPVYADPDLLMQVLTNLLDNACRFAASRIVMRAQAAVPTAPRERGWERGSTTTAERPGVLISVVDDGPGIPPDKIGELFDRFVQVNRPREGGGYKGTGLGLAICKQIIELQDGRIWAESEPGAGASFHVHLPGWEGQGETS